MAPCTCLCREGQVLDEADESIHHLPAVVVGVASGEEHQQLLIAVPSSCRQTYRTRSVSTGCSTVRWQGGLYQMPSPGPSCRGGMTPAAEPPCMGLCREESCLFSLAYCTLPHHTSSLQHLLSGLCTGQQEHKEPLRDVVEASRHHSSTGDTYRNSYYCQRSAT
jgi:hypothetical protein